MSDPGAEAAANLFKNLKQNPANKVSLFAVYLAIYFTYYHFCPLVRSWRAVEEFAV